MFTGIITDIGRIESVIPGGDIRFVLETAFETDGIGIGASIACSGVCLTVIEKGPHRFSVAASAETLSKTTLGTWREGTRVNLERALRMGDDLGGHIVSGHVDGTGRVETVGEDGDSLRFLISLPNPLMSLVAPKGSITVDGVSLTVNSVDGNRVGLNIIDHTRKATTLGDRKPGDIVNVEIDMLARYVARLLEREQS